MGEIALRSDEKIGLGAAVLLHGALVGVLALQTMRSEVAVFPERINVSLTTEVGLEAAAPDPVPESRMAAAPTIDINPAPASAAAKPEPAPRVQPVPPKPPARTATQQPAPTRDRSRPDRTPPKPATTPPRQTAGKPGGAPRIGDDFLGGKGSSTTTTETRAPAPKYGPSELASLDSAVGRQVKIKWQGRVPQGPDADKLVTRVRFRLNPDGTLAGEPQVLDTLGVTDLNRNQVARHREEAVRAVKLVGQFNVPFPVPADKTFTLKFERNR
ncbi:MAG: energy transducer TonB [Erythrobacter sp.]